MFATTAHPRKPRGLPLEPLQVLTIEPPNEVVVTSFEPRHDAAELRDSARVLQLLPVHVRPPVKNPEGSDVAGGDD